MGFVDMVVGNIEYQTFLKIIHAIPSCIFYKDDQLRYQFCTKRWTQLDCDDIIGMTDMEIHRGKKNARIAMDSDRKILETGVGCSYVIQSVGENNTVAYLEIIKEPIFDENHKAIGIVGLINDVTQKTLYEHQLKELSSTDSLTKLYNRKTGVDIIEELLAEHSHNRAFMLMDLNKFKHINDAYGHQIGDSVLREFGATIKKCLYKDDVALRLGGDEFVIFLADIKEQADVEGFLRKFASAVSNIKIDGFDGKLTASVGVKIVSEGDSFDSLYGAADSLMYEAKQAGLPYIIR